MTFNHVLCRFEPGRLYMAFKFSDFSSKQEVKDALAQARRYAKNARDVYGKESQEAVDALKNCNDLQFILDRWDIFT